MLSAYPFEAEKFQKPEHMTEQTGTLFSHQPHRLAHREFADVAWQEQVHDACVRPSGRRASVCHHGPHFPHRPARGCVCVGGRGRGRRQRAMIHGPSATLDVAVIPHVVQLANQPGHKPGHLRVILGADVDVAHAVLVDKQPSKPGALE